MSEHSQISWCTSTWNPVVGCQKVSDGCDNCYAIRDGWRMGHNPNEKIRKAYSALVYRLNGRLNWTGTVRTLPERLEIPLHWKTPRRIFVNSQSDLFHADVPFEFIDKVFDVMARTPQHVYQILTKRPSIMHRYVDHWLSRQDGRESPRGTIKALPNVWLGTSVEDQKTAEARIPSLLVTPAAVRFVSYEPALGPVDLTHLQVMGHSLDALRGEWCADDTGCLVIGKGDEALSWIICGGESGPRARPFNINWARQIIRQCKAAGVAVFIKQIGAHPYACRESVNGETDHAGCIQEGLEDIKNKKGDDPSEWSEDLRVQEFPQHLPQGNSVAGRR